MTSHQERRNGIEASHGTPVAMNPALYNPLAPSQLSYPYSGIGQAAQNKEEMVAALGQMNLNGFSAPTNGNTPSNLLPMAMNNLLASGATYYHLPDGRIIPSRLPSSLFQQGRSDNSISNAQSPSLPYLNAIQSNPALATMGPGMNMPWALGHTRDGVMPDLTAPRRTSLSSNEENGPRTPFFGASNQTDAHPKVVVGGSPHPWTTPSPHQLNIGSSPSQIAKSPTGQYYFADLNSICLQDPPIPKPIPAIFSGEKGRGTLEKSLQNNLNTTNVYIRGLHPNTTDEMLHSYGARFGKIISAKSMLEQETGNCKGFGFIKYHNFNDGENCIRAFFHWGYEAKWARVSHNEKLKTLGDDNNTNLYVSNLPLDFNEHSLMGVFDDFEVLSAKILRDTNGMSRGVGFARFATPDVCREVIEQYNGVKVGEDGNLLSIRFADTPEQKKLKSITAERRQYKAAEYNTAAYSPGSPYASSVATNPYNSPLQPRTTNAYWANQSPLASLYAAYAAATNVPMSTSTKVPLAPGQENIDLNARHASRARTDSPGSAGLSKRLPNNASPAKSDLGVKIEQRYPLSNHSDVKSSPVKPNQYSPIKNSPSKTHGLRS